jgi:hypothetical protein
MILNQTKKCLCAAVVGALGLTVAQANLVTFDDVGLNALDDITTQYAGQGVTFNGVTDGGANVNIEVADNGTFADNNPVSSPNSLANFYGQNKFNRAHIMQILFSSAASGISFYYNGAGSQGASTVFNVYDTGHLLIDTFSVAAATDSTFHLVTLADTGVGELDIVNPQSGWGHYIDNLSFNNSTRAPDAAVTASLLAASLAVLGAVRRKLS